MELKLIDISGIDRAVIISGEEYLKNLGYPSLKAAWRDRRIKYILEEMIETEIANNKFLMMKLGVNDKESIGKSITTLWVDSTHGLVGVERYAVKSFEDEYKRIEWHLNSGIALYTNLFPSPTFSGDIVTLELLKRAYQVLPEWLKPEVARQLLT